MSEYLGKREEEREAISDFLTEYAHATGVSLELSAEGERPDFLCRRPDGTLVGVELTKIGHTPPEALDLAILTGTSAVDVFTVLDMAVLAAQRKDAKRASPGWFNAHDTMLVLQLVSPPDVPLESIFDEQTSDEFSHLGFTEVWIMDCESLEAFGTPTLFGLFPESIWGPKERSNWWQKPYG
jgi:hypothetical protein